MTDYPRFQKLNSPNENAHEFFHGARIVTLVLRIADAWALSASRRPAPLVLKASLLASLALALAVTQTLSQDTVRVRGTIEASHGDVYTIRTRSNDIVHAKVSTEANIAASVRSSLADIRPGLYIGVAAVPQSDGTLRALEAHIFHETMRGTGEGHRAWDLLPASTMTNAVVEDVIRTVHANSVTLRYKDGQQTISIPPATTIVTYLPSDRSELRPGAAVFIPAAARNADGTLSVARIMVGRDIDPPQ